VTVVDILAGTLASLTIPGIVICVLGVAAWFFERDEGNTNE